MKAQILLADSAQALGGKLYMLGGGWSIIGPEPAPMAIAVTLELPADQANVSQELVIELVHADGKPFTITPEEGGSPQPLRLAGSFEASPSPDVDADAPLSGTFAINIAPLPLEPGRRYAWLLRINGETQPDWQASFSVRRK